MASTLTAVDLANLPPPVVVEPIAYETILADMLVDLRQRDPVFSALVESDPAYKILEVAAYRETLIRQRVNDGAHAVMLAYATGTDLDNLAALYGVQRLVVVPGDTTRAPVFESDAAFRTRIVLSLEGYTTAGSRGSYAFHALSADGDVADVGVTSLIPGTVNVSVLSHSGNGVPSATLLDKVTAALNDETVRPLCDTVHVEAASLVAYAISAQLILYPGIDQASVIDAARAAAEKYVAGQYKIGRDIILSGVYAALHQPGVQRVELTQPNQDLVIGWNQAGHCSGIALAFGGYDE